MLTVFRYFFSFESLTDPRLHFSNMPTMLETLYMTIEHYMVYT